MVLQGEALPVERVLREQARGQGDRGDQDAAREAEQGQRAAAVKHGRRVGKESSHLPLEGEFVTIRMMTHVDALPCNQRLLSTLSLVMLSRHDRSDSD